MEYIEEISNNINGKISKLNNLNEKFNKNKEEIKNKIINIMTNLIEKIKERQNELLLNLDSIFECVCPSEKELKDFGELPNKINEILSKNNEIDKKYYDPNTLIFYFNDCINIENNVNFFKERINSIDKYDKISKIKYFFSQKKKILINYIKILNHLVKFIFLKKKKKSVI